MNNSGEQRQRSLLVIDDEPDIVEIVRLVAEGKGFRVVSSTDPEKFPSIFRRDMDIVVLDLAMPKLDGVEIIRFLGDTRSSVGVVLMSGFDSAVLNSARELAIARGVNILGVLEKPIQIRDLESLLDKNPPLPVASSPRIGGEPVSPEELRAAIANGEIEAHYQPKVDIASKRLIGFEALARWQHSVKGMIPPGLFIPVAEKNGLIKPLTLAVIDHALAQCGKWKRDGLVAKIAINFSAKTMIDLDFPDDFSAKVASYDLLPSQVVIELTESSIVETMATSLDIFTRLRMKGFYLSIDDFGTGYSSMLQLHKIPFNELKIDQSFVSVFDRNAGARSIIESTINLGHKLQMVVVAEGVESQACLDYLGRSGCQEAQGYFIGKPMPADRIESWRRERNL